MARVHIELPARFCFATEIGIRITDLNYGGHVGNDTFLAIIQEARVRFLKTVGYIHEGEGPGGLGLIMGDAAIVYKGEVRYGDTLVVEIAAGDYTTLGFDLFYRILRSSDQTIVAVAKTGLVGFDYRTGKVARVPKEVRERIESLRPLQ
jgi:acyl-CoA thioesterase FadM